MDIEQSEIPPKNGGKRTLYPELHLLKPTHPGEAGDCKVYSISDELKVRAAVNYLTRTRGWLYTTRSDKEEATFTVWRRPDPIQQPAGEPNNV